MDFFIFQILEWNKNGYIFKYEVILVDSNRSEIMEKINWMIFVCVWLTGITYSFTDNCIENEYSY